jgi:glycosyltransferase involved in cell wall biosynthesis
MRRHVAIMVPPLARVRRTLPAGENPAVAPTVVVDVRDGFAPQARGWGRYARCLWEAMSTGEVAPGLGLTPITDGGVGPEIAFEQLKLPLYLRRQRAALVHVTNCFLPLVRSCPGVVTIHDLAFETWPEDFASVTRRKYQVFARLAARSAERVICPSSFTRDDVAARYGVDPARLRVIAEAPALRIGEDVSPEPPYVLAVGDLRQKKNLAALVAAFVRVWRRTPALAQHRLVLAGVDAGEGSRLRGLAGDAPLELTGYLSDARLDALIRGAELLVHPSLYEGFGLVVLEAMARGTPVLAAQATALPETGGEAAAYFDGSHELTRQLHDLLSDDGVRAELSRRGRERAATFSWQRAAAETVAVYRELL